MRLLALGVVGSLLCGCVLLHDDAAPGGGGSGVGAGGTGAGAAGAGGAGLGGSGGVGGAGGQAPVCPGIHDPRVLDDGVDAQKGAISTINGQIVFGGQFTTQFNFPTIIPFTPTVPNFYVATMAATGPELQPLHAVPIVANAGAASLRRIIATSDGGSAAIVSGIGLIAEDNNTGTQNDASALDALLIKLSSTGELEWSLLLEGGIGEVSVDLLQATPNGVLVGGTSLGPLDLLSSLRLVGSDPELSNLQVTTPSMFLFTCDNAGNGLVGNTTVFKNFQAPGHLVALREHDGRRFLFGGYSGPFPDFGGSNAPIGPASSERLFVVELDSVDHAMSKRDFGFGNRTNVPVGIVDTGDGFALFSYTASDATLEGVFGASYPEMNDPAPTVSIGAHVGVVTKVDYELHLQWVQTDLMSTDGGVRMHSPGLSQGKLVYGYGLGDPNSQVTIGAESCAQVACDSVFVRRDPTTGESTGVLKVGPQLSPGGRADIQLSNSECGTLVVGGYDADFTFQGFTAPAGLKPRGFVGTYFSGLTFP